MEKETSHVEKVPANTPEELAAIAAASQDGKSAGKEIQSLRAEKKALQEQLEAKESNVAVTPEEIATMVQKGIKSALDEKSKASRETNLESAIERFKNEQEGFDSKNDPEGEKFAKVQSELDNFKLDGYSSEEDFLNGINKANTLAYGASAPAKATPVTPSHTHTPGNSVETKTNVENTKVRFSPEEKEIFEIVGMPIEQATKLKLENFDAYSRIIEG